MSLPASSSVSKAPALLSASGSVSFHRITASNSNSSRRLRSSTISELEPGPGKLDDEKQSDGIPPTPRSPVLPLFISFNHENRRYSVLRWTCFLYCVTSVVLFTAYLIGLNISQFFIDIPFQHDESALVSQSRLGQLIQGTSPTKPGIVSVEPFITGRQSLDLQDITACLWIEPTQVHDIVRWSKLWRGM